MKTTEEFKTRNPLLGVSDNDLCCTSTGGSQYGSYGTNNSLKTKPPKPLRRNISSSVIENENNETLSRDEEKRRQLSDWYYIKTEPKSKQNNNSLPSARHRSSQDIQYRMNQKDLDERESNYINNKFYEENRCNFQLRERQPIMLDNGLDANQNNARQLNHGSNGDDTNEKIHKEAELNSMNKRDYGLQATTPSYRDHHHQQQHQHGNRNAYNDEIVNRANIQIGTDEYYANQQLLVQDDDFGRKTLPFNERNKSLHGMTYNSTDGLFDKNGTHPRTGTGDGGGGDRNHYSSSASQNEEGRQQLNYNNPNEFTEPNKMDGKRWRENYFMSMMTPYSTGSVPGKVSKSLNEDQVSLFSYCLIYHVVSSSFFIIWSDHILGIH